MGGRVVRRVVLTGKSGFVGSDESRAGDEDKQRKDMDRACEHGIP